MESLHAIFSAILQVHRKYPPIFMYGNENFMHALKSPTVKAVHWSLGCWQEQVLKRLHVLKEEDIKKLDLDSNQFFTHHLLKDLLRCQSGISDWFTRPKTSSIERALILRCLLEWSFVSETAFKELCRLTNQAHPKFAATVAAADEEKLWVWLMCFVQCVFTTTLLANFHHIHHPVTHTCFVEHALKLTVPIFLFLGPTPARPVQILGHLESLASIYPESYVTQNKVVLMTASYVYHSEPQLGKIQDSFKMEDLSEQDNINLQSFADSGAGLVAFLNRTYTLKTLPCHSLLCVEESVKLWDKSAQQLASGCITEKLEEMELNPNPSLCEVRQSWAGLVSSRRAIVNQFFLEDLKPISLDWKDRMDLAALEEVLDTYYASRIDAAFEEVVDAHARRIDAGSCKAVIGFVYLLTDHFLQEDMPYHDTNPLLPLYFILTSILTYCHQQSFTSQQKFQMFFDTLFPTGNNHTEQSLHAYVMKCVSELKVLPPEKDQFQHIHQCVEEVSNTTNIENSGHLANASDGTPNEEFEFHPTRVKKNSKKSSETEKTGKPSSLSRSDQQCKITASALIDLGTDSPAGHTDVNPPDLGKCDESLVHTPQQKHLQQRLQSLSRSDQQCEIAVSALIDLGTNSPAWQTDVNPPDLVKCDETLVRTPQQKHLQQRLQTSLTKKSTKRSSVSESLTPRSGSKRSRKQTPIFGSESKKV